MNLYDINCTLSSGEEFPLSRLKGKVILVVNTASRCKFTEQYDELEVLSSRYGEDLEVLAFPCNQFASQEPGSDEEIASFCQVNFNTTFKIFKKCDVNGENAHPLFKYLQDDLRGLLGTKAIKWNFTKFLIARDGTPFKRYAPSVPPRKLTADIERLIET